MPYHPERGLGAADPGGHRHSGSPGGSHGTRIHSPDLSLVPETEAAPGPPPGSGRGPAAVGDQPRIQYGAGSGQPHCRLREEGWLPTRTIQWYLRTVHQAHQLKLSAGAIAGVAQQVAQQARPTVAEALERIRSSPVVHADETGWRENGVNGCVWTFSPDCQRCEFRRSLALLTDRV